LVFSLDCYTQLGNSGFGFSFAVEDLAGQQMFRDTQ
jgi:hypothetical protein